VQSRRDHVQAYQFATNRLTSALVTGDPGRGQTPFRRASLGVIAGIIIAALLSGGAVIYGLLDPASAATSWRQQGSVVLDEQTGTRFIYLDGMLHPTANYASAVLVAGARAAVHAVPHSALAHVPVGDTIGINGAPEMLPAAMLPGTWAVCLAPGSRSGLALDLGAGQHATSGTAGRLMLVAGSTGEQYVLWDNAKYPVAERAALVAFGLGNQAPLPAPAGWLADLPTGPALASPLIQRLGTAGFPVGGRPTPIGSVFDASAAGADQFYVLLSSGLAPLSRTEAALLEASGRVGPVQHVTPAVVAAAPASPDRSLLSGVPDLLAGTAYQPSGTAVCIRQTSPAGPSVNTVITDAAAAGATGVLVPPGTGMIVQPPSAGGFATAPLYLVTDTGFKYALADSNAVTALGYSNVTPQVMPPSILSRIPSGPALSVAGARAAVNAP
jgi:type VII secretion protein EccB